MGVIYTITSPNGKLYVGKTYNLRKRIASHKCGSKKGSTIILHNSIKKHGWDNHLIQVIEECVDDLLNVREMYWIHILKTYCYENKMGMNMTLGGDGQRSTWMHDTERRKKASIHFRGENNPFKGKKHTEETKRILGEKASKRNKETGKMVPQWGVDKGREMSSKKVVVYNLNGNYIGHYKSCSEAARELGLTTGEVTVVARGEQLHSHNMVFKFYDKLFPNSIDTSKLKFLLINRPLVLINQEQEIMRIYASAKEASLELNRSASNISRRALLYNGTNRKSGYTFVYLDDYQNSHKLN